MRTGLQPDIRRGEETKICDIHQHIRAQIWSFKCVRCTRRGEVMGSKLQGLLPRWDWNTVKHRHTFHLPSSAVFSKVDSFRVWARSYALFVSFCSSGSTPRQHDVCPFDYIISRPLVGMIWLVNSALGHPRSWQSGTSAERWESGWDWDFRHLCWKWEWLSIFSSGRIRKELQWTYHLYCLARLHGP
mgnify:CR=1 FL=1